MTFVIFLIVLGVLVFVHELGHFLVAKRANVEVEEFGFGYPPRALKIGEKWGTLFTLNWIPFGGFVKIVGENYEVSSSSETEKSTDISLLGNSLCSPQSGSQGIFQHSDSKNLNFTQVSKKWQAAILAAGVVFNFIFAWVLFSVGFVVGLPTSVENNFGAEVKNPSLTVIGLVSDYPAEKSGLKTGDKIKKVSLKGGDDLKILNPENVSDFINEASGSVLLEVQRGDKNLNFEITPEASLAENRKIIGINMDMVGTLSLPIHRAIYQGGKATLELSYLTVGGISDLIKDAVRGKADMSSVAGPVGIIGLVGDASRLGFVYLLTFTALISINLAIINLIPFPALDGGRIVFVAFEGITRRKINQKFASILNTAGFILLIGFMLIITYRDILKLF